MNHGFRFFCLMIIGGCFAATTTLAQDQGYAELSGSWQVVELVDNGRVIPRESIPGWLPSGGRVEIVDNSIVFTSPKNGQRHARTFQIDAASYPKSMDLVDNGRIYGHGIYRLDKGRLVICLASPDEAPRPTDFAAPPNSHRVLMVSERIDDVEPPATIETRVQNEPVQAVARPRVVAAPPVVVAPQVVTPTNVVAAPQVIAVPTTVTISVVEPTTTLPPPPDIRISPPGRSGITLTNAEVLSMLMGTWKANDAHGELFLTMEANGRYNTYRETIATSTFQKVFARIPVSSGNWSLNNGRVVFRCTSSVQPERVNMSLPFQVRSITPTDLIFVDYAGKVGQAVKLR